MATPSRVAPLNVTSSARMRRVRLVQPDVASQYVAAWRSHVAVGLVGIERNFAAVDGVDGRHVRTVERPGKRAIEHDTGQGRRRR